MNINGQKKNIILFDLDGTVVDSGEGITKCVYYSAQKMGFQPPELEALKVFVGPPLKEMFMEFFNVDSKGGSKMVDYYRRRYHKKGIYEQSVYEKIPETLAYLKNKGMIIALATSKPEEYARKILQYFQLDSYFDFIGGSTFDEERNTKAKVITYVLHMLGVDEKEKVVMVGDRLHDILGAKQTGISCIGVLYGYGDYDELKGADADVICDKIENLMNL